MAVDLFSVALIAALVFLIAAGWQSVAHDPGRAGGHLPCTYIDIDRAGSNVQAHCSGVSLQSAQCEGFDGE